MSVVIDFIQPYASDMFMFFTGAYVGVVLAYLFESKLRGW